MNCRILSTDQNCQVTDYICTAFLFASSRCMQSGFSRLCVALVYITTWSGQLWLSRSSMSGTGWVLLLCRAASKTHQSSSHSRPLSTSMRRETLEAEGRATARYVIKTRSIATAPIPTPSKAEGTCTKEPTCRLSVKANNLAGSISSQIILLASIVFPVDTAVVNVATTPCNFVK